MDARRPVADLLALSPFLADACRRDAAFDAWVQADGAGTWRAPPVPDAALPGFGAALPAFGAALRNWRRTSLAAIAWQALRERLDLPATLEATSEVADQALRAAHDAALAPLVARHGRPRDAAGVEQGLVILAMGKLGGRELNFSSDIDLIFLFPSEGETDGPRPVSNEQFFTQLGRSLIKLLDEVTAEGFVFRVDMRLRPFGDSGALVSSFAAIEDYLQTHGRDWERYAWIKARPVTGTDAYAELYRDVVRPFVYRRYLDFGVFESLREMKRLIEREVARRELAPHLKLGPGGIREIEFIVQSLQLLRGGLDQRLQTPSLLKVLPLLATSRALPEEAVQRLRAGYVLLRRAENALQMRADEQTHVLPEEESARATLAALVGARDWASLSASLVEARAAVAQQFHALLFGAPAADTTEPARLATLLEAGDAAALAGALGELGFQDPPAVAGWILETIQSGVLARLDAPGRKRLLALLPPLVVDAAAGKEADAALRRLLRLLASIGRRSSYFALLIEQPGARRRLVGLARQGDFLLSLIEASPLLLDELLDPALSSEVPTRAQFARDLAQRQREAADGDEEQQAGKLAQFQRAALFRVAVADLDGRLPVMQVSDRLTDIAELVLEEALALASRHLTAQWGVPMCGEGAARRPVRLCVAGYGKLGGMELGYSSDLDLVFLHDSEGEAQHTDGARSVDNQVYFVRYAQRVVHLLTVQTTAGRLYEVDMRLRPSGKGGMLITGIDAFADYQRGEAWTWEHQALLHARAVAGDPVLRARFEALRLDILQQQVRRETLRDEVRQMRERQRRERPQGASDRFDLKNGRGGIGDIEFLAQYWALLHARDYPPVAWFADTIRQLESVASADLVPQASVDCLTAAYRAYRNRLHHRSLGAGGADVADEEFAAERAGVAAIWDATMQV